MAALKTYRPDIDGMRAIAVLSVVAFHYGLPLSGGFIGVDVFFVISGYLIGSLIYREACQGRFSFRTFYVRRARRIAPALLVVLGVTYVVMLGVATPIELREFGESALATVFSSSNVYFWRSIGYFHTGADLNPLLMTWSLGVEEQFYLLAPVFLLLLPKMAVRRRFALLIGVIAASLAAAAWGVQHSPQMTFYVLPTRAWELAAGVLLGVFHLHRRPSDTAGSSWVIELAAASGLVLLVAPAFLCDTQTPFPGVAAVPPVLGTVLLLSTARSAINRHVLSVPPMRFIGLISYSLYLWHWPLISVTRLMLEYPPPASVRTALLALSAALAWLSYRYVELPFRRSRSPAVTSLWRYAGVLGLFALLTGSAILLRGVPARWPHRFAAMEKMAVHDRDRCLLLFGSATPNISAQCYPGSGSVVPLVALVGDSHAAALAPGLRALAKRNGVALVQLTKASCPFMVGVSRQATSHPELMANCAAFDQKVMRLLLGDKRIRTVVIAGFWRAGDMRDANYAATQGTPLPSDVLLAHGLTAAVSTLQRGGKNVFIVRDVPFINFLPLKREASCASGLRAALNNIDSNARCSFARLSAITSDAPAHAILRKVAHNTGAQLADPRSVLCDERRCRIAQDGHLLYRDQQHLTREGAVFASASLAAAVLGSGTTTLHGHPGSP